MAKAHIRTPEGTEVALEGTPQEVAAVLRDLKVKTAPQAGAQKRGAGKPKRTKLTITDLVADLKQGGFFKEPRGLTDIRRKLAELGYHYPLTTLSGSMQGQVRRRNLRRFREKGKYVYAQ